MVRILLTTTSFQDTPGSHHERLDSQGFEVVRARGPLSEEAILNLSGDFDAFLCGDDVISRKVLEKSLPRLKLISKYGIGVDKIDVEAATELGIPVTFCPGVNHTTVAEHCFALMLALVKNLVPEVDYTRQGQWKRLIGNEIMGKTIGVLGLGRIGKEVVKRAKAFGMPCMGYDVYWDESFAAEYEVQKLSAAEELFSKCDIISLHTNLTDSTRHIIRDETLKLFRENAIVINCARGELVDTKAMAKALQDGKIKGYGTDVLDEEPPAPDHPLLKIPNCIVTPHIGSRTHESVQRQAGMAVENLILALSGKKPLAQVNKVPVKAVS